MRRRKNVRSNRNDGQLGFGGVFLRKTGAFAAVFRFAGKGAGARCGRGGSRAEITDFLLRSEGFLYVSRPVYARGAAGSSKRGFTVSFGLWEKLQSERILFVAHPTERWWIHHLFLSSQGQIDAELMGWVEQAHALRQWANGRKF